MHIPMIRFPGGTDIDYTDWRDLVDSAAMHGPRAPTLTGHTGKSIGTRFGIDEYFALRDDLGNQTTLVVNFLDAVAMRLPITEAARRAAGLVAYANTPLGSARQDDMPDWAAVRAANGHPEPFKAEFIQIGNEWWSGDFLKLVTGATGPLTPRAMADWYRECLHAYILAIRAVDRDIGIIIDGDPGAHVDKILYEDEILRREVAFLALHAYGPGPVDSVSLAQSAVLQKLLTPDEWWWAWVGALGARDDQGHCQGLGSAASHLIRLGYRIAYTEWNWNGFGFHHLRTHPGEYRLAAALGSASFLNGLIRHGAHVRIATQSMLIGTTWGISAILVPDGASEPIRAPTGQVTTLYARNHGRWHADHRAALCARVAATDAHRHP